MKIKKLIAAALALTCATPLVLCACDPKTGGNGGDDDEVKVGEGMKQYILEAEYTPVADKIGGAQSGSASGYDLIIQSSADGVSNGYFVSNMHMTDCTLEFEFNAERAGTAALYIRMFSQWGNTTFNPDNFGVVLNGEEITYTSLLVQGASDDNPKFADKVVTQKANIKQGKNVLELIVRENTLNTYTHSTGAPAIDCVKIVTDTGISWNPIEENLDHVGSIIV
ncbi:MAG: hypothetical protein J1F39_05095 [Clostridiales bacterium]|nr:hypothetical protein [Clostridiales bacterium]